MSCALEGVKDDSYNGVVSYFPNLYPNIFNSTGKFSNFGTKITP